MFDFRVLVRSLNTTPRYLTLCFVILLFLSSTAAVAATQASKLVLTPTKGPATTSVKLSGLTFGSAKGKVKFGSTEIQDSDVTWPDKDGGVTIIIPTLSQEPTSSTKYAVEVLNGSGASLGTATFAFVPVTKAASADEDPLDITLIGGFEQGYQSAQQSNSYGFIDFYGDKLFAADKLNLGPFFGIRLQTAPQASSTNNIVSVFTNPSGAITTQSLQSVGSAVDLNVGMEFRLKANFGSDNVPTPGKTSLDLILGGGFVSPIQANTISANFLMPSYGSVECAELQKRLSSVINAAPYAGTIRANTADTTGDPCFSNIGGSKPVTITNLLYATPDRSSFYGKAFAGLRFTNWWKSKSDNQSACDNQKNLCAKGMVDFTFGQNASITGGLMRHFVFTIDGIHPLPVKQVSFIYLFGSISKRFQDGNQTLPPLILETGKALQSAPTDSDLVLPLTQPDRDFYRIGAGISLDQIFKKLANP